MNMELIHVFIQHTDYEITVGKMMLRYIVTMKFYSRPTQGCHFE